MGRKAARRPIVPCLLALVLAPLARAAEPLPSWNDREAKQSILRFVESVTHEGTPTYVAPAERIAVFDNDGTLWAEQPVYFQLLFAVDQVNWTGCPRRRGSGWRREGASPT
jgi:hypothetical protein